MITFTPGRFPFFAVKAKEENLEFRYGNDSDFVFRISDLVKRSFDL